jgi:2-iminobutanoate/2-iminopropanoate deaminase
MKQIIGSSLLLLISAFGFSQVTSKQVIVAEKAPQAIGPYSHGILAGNTLYISGQIAIDPATGQMDTMNIEAETRRVLSNLGAVLEEAGMSYANVVKVTIFTTNLKNYKAINSLYGEYFKSQFPAWEAIQVGALPGNAHIEISAIAVK